MTVELDPRWEWIYCPELGGPTAHDYVKVRCNHLEVLPVHVVTGTHIADWCRTCDTQFLKEPADQTRPCVWD